MQSIALLLFLCGVVVLSCCLLFCSVCFCFFFLFFFKTTRLQDELKEHRDGSILSFNILLNKASEFRGGGTKFSGIQSGLTVRNEKGG
jgi:hypothetical protein